MDQAQGFSVTQRDFTLASRRRHLPVDASEPHASTTSARRISPPPRSSSSSSFANLAVDYLHPTITQRKIESHQAAVVAYRIAAPCDAMPGRSSRLLGSGLLRFCSRWSCTAACAACQVGRARPCSGNSTTRQLLWTAVCAQ
jgi:hypothetical protein